MGKKAQFTNHSHHPRGWPCCCWWVTMDTMCGCGLGLGLKYNTIALIVKALWILLCHLTPSDCGTCSGRCGMWRVSKTGCTPSWKLRVSCTAISRFQWWRSNKLRHCSRSESPVTSYIWYITWQCYYHYKITWKWASLVIFSSSFSTWLAILMATPTNV